MAMLMMAETNKKALASDADAWMCGQDVGELRVQANFVGKSWCIGCCNYALCYRLNGNCVALCLRVRHSTHAHVRLGPFQEPSSPWAMQHPTIQ